MSEADKEVDKIQDLLAQAAEGDEGATGELFQVLYGELKKHAKTAMRGQRPGHTLQPTAILNEAYLRIAGGSNDWKTRDHFLLAASRAMRHVLVDHARRKSRFKRDGARASVPVEELATEFEENAYSLKELDTVLDELAELDNDMARAVELRFFAGATVEETARILGLTTRTFERHWQAARDWLHGRLA